MADTLIREAIAYSSQPLSPVPQYWNGTSYEKAQGVNGAIRVINYTSSGETFSGASPGSVQLTATSTVAISGTSTVSYSGTNTVEVVTSAGGTSYFSGTNPASVQLTATSTVTFSGSESVNVSTVPVVGTQANAWSASATISAGATSNAIDLQYNYQISFFGTVTNTASITLTLEVSQDNSNWYTTTASLTVTAGTTSNFHSSETTAARYVRLSASGVSATITATIAGK